MKKNGEARLSEIRFWATGFPNELAEKYLLPEIAYKHEQANRRHRRPRHGRDPDGLRRRLEGRIRETLGTVVYVGEFQFFIYFS